MDGGGANLEGLHWILTPGPSEHQISVWNGPILAKKNPIQSTSSCCQGHCSCPSVKECLFFDHNNWEQSRETMTRLRDVEHSWTRSPPLIHYVNGEFVGRTSKAGQTSTIPWRWGGGTSAGGGVGGGPDSIATNINTSIFLSFSPLKAAIFQSDGYCKHHSSTQHYETRYSAFL